MGLAWQVRARLRPLQAWEQPPDADLSDDRMVEFFVAKDGMTVLDAVGTYYPLLAPDLLPDFLALFAHEPLAPERKVAEFYARYGALNEHVLISGERRPAWAERLTPENRGRLSTGARLGFCEPMWWLRERARDLQVTYDIYAALREQRLPALRAILGGVPKGKRIASIGMFAGQVTCNVTDDTRGSQRRAGSYSVEPNPVTVIDPSDFVPLPDDDVLFWARQLLAYQLNTGESRSKRRWDQYVDLPGIPTPREQQALGIPDSDPLGLVRCRSAQDLTAAMYLQLGELVARHVVLYQCEGCGRLFYRRHGKQRFCAASCGDAARQRDYYQNAKAAAARPAKRQTRKRR